MEGNMKGKLLAMSLAAVLLPVTVSFAASVEKADMLNQHGLTQEAKSELIDVIFSKSADPNKAKAYYLLGSIAFDQNKVSVALDSWRKLVNKYPNSSEAKEVKDRINELAEIVGDSAKESIKNAIALSYLRHGDFWSKGKENKFTIDSSWIPNVETAVKWYDKVISEFPKSAASRIAYQNKLRTLLGWKESGKYGSSYGIKSSFSVYIPQLLETYSSFEKEHPTASTLQGFRYQIAQTYWSNKDWGKTREWLNLIIKRSGGSNSFYKDVAERRLKKVEY
jgi:tetratricopeptide (TPR) repeat protein